MAQIFSSRVGLYSKCLLIGTVALVFAGVLAWRAVTGPAYAIGTPVPQPVPFSHKHHVGDEGLDCRYCHSPVETEASAGFPPVSTCMGCHSQLYTNQQALAPLVKSWESGVPMHWQRVNDLPDFVFFNHSIHVAKGVGCVECHGRIDRMPLTARAASLSMAWCLDCHRDPAPHLRPRDKVFVMDWHGSGQPGSGEDLVRSYHIKLGKLTECSLCHR